MDAKQSCQTNADFVDPIICREAIKLSIAALLLAIYIRLLVVLMTRRKLFANVFFTIVLVNGVAVRYLEGNYYIYLCLDNYKLCLQYYND
jgi:hypothetical protein